jgi:hypothetical protein
MQLEKCFSKVLSTLPDNIVIQDIDVMFNPDYKVDVLKLLIAVNKHKPFSLIWPGRIENGKLIYSEEIYPDYRVFDVKDYDVLVIV